MTKIHSSAPYISQASLAATPEPGRADKLHGRLRAESVSGTTRPADVDASAAESATTHRVWAELAQRFGESTAELVVSRCTEFFPALGPEEFSIKAREMAEDIQSVNAGVAAAKDLFTK